jgi:oxygen-independent coproporphyrinogen-3 oxidase
MQEKKIDNLPHSAYVHIPFCQARCHYCDFPIALLGKQTNDKTVNTVEQYIEILGQEISHTPFFGKNLHTVSFGGGTPSLLSIEQLEVILQNLDRYFGIADGAEISIEIDPGTFNLEKLQGYRSLGVTRLSLGVQAFQDELLQLCGRSHSREDIFKAIELIERANFVNFSLDLISGLPNQSLQQWKDSLNQALTIAPAHLSCYDLVLEENTAFGKRYEPGTRPLPEDETAANMYRLAASMLKDRGYEHYEISNYAKPGFQSRHNRVYWENRSYYGFGMGAASYLNGCRFTRPPTKRAYYRWVEEFIVDKTLISFPQISQIDLLLETLMLGLRLADGIDLYRLKQDFGCETIQNFKNCLLPYYRQGWVSAISSQGDLVKEENILDAKRLRLSDPDGFLFSNTILSTLFKQLNY